MFYNARGPAVAVAQLAEHQTVALGVAGSSPVGHPSGEPLRATAGTGPPQKGTWAFPRSDEPYGFGVQARGLARQLEEDTLVCGDDPAAKKRVTGLAQALRTRGVDADRLEQLATLERLAALVIGLNLRYRRRAVGVRFVGL